MTIAWIALFVITAGFLFVLFRLGKVSEDLKESREEMKDSLAGHDVYYYTQSMSPASFVLLFPRRPVYLARPTPQWMIAEFAFS